LAVTYDPAKRDNTLTERQLDFADADIVIEGAIFEAPDDRNDYGETRIITVGFLKARMVIVVWTARGEDRHIISMRHAHAKEQRRYATRLD
jgi:uncharacterized DUF497 family protein